MFYFHCFCMFFFLWVNLGTMRRNRLPKSGHCDKINFGGCDNGRSIEQPLFIKSKEDGSWTSVHNSAYHFSQASTMSLASSITPLNAAIFSNNNNTSTNKFKLNTSNNSINSPNLNNSSNNINNATISSNQIHLSSFGRADNV